MTVQMIIEEFFDLNLLSFDFFLIFSSHKS